MAAVISIGQLFWRRYGQVHTVELSNIFPAFINNFLYGLVQPLCYAGCIIKHFKHQYLLDVGQILPRHRHIPSCYWIVGDYIFGDSLEGLINFLHESLSQLGQFFLRIMLGRESSDAFGSGLENLDVLGHFWEHPICYEALYSI